MNQFLPRGCHISSENRIKKMVASGCDWQIYLTNLDTYVLAVKTALYDKWIADYSLPERIFLNELINDCKVFLSSSNYLVSSMERGPYPEDNGQIEAFSIAFKTAKEPEIFTKKVLEYCKKKYASLGIDKVHGECVITSFYGSICATLFYLKNPSEVRGNDIFDFLNDHIDMEFTDVNAEKMLGTKAGEEKAENIWNLFSPYVSLAQAAFKAVDELTDDILLEAMRNSYLLGMLVAITNSTTKKNTQGNHEKLDKELSDLSKKEKPDDTPPQPSAMCYSPRY